MKRFCCMVFTDLAPMILTTDGKDYSAVEKKGVMMHCKVFSSPPSAVSWYVCSLLPSPIHQ